MGWACQTKEIRQELITGSAKHITSLIALCHMQIGALTLMKDQATSLTSIQVVWSTGCLQKYNGKKKKEHGTDTGLALIFISTALPRSLILGCKPFELCFLDHFLSTVSVHVSPDLEQTMLFLFLDMLFAALANPHILTWRFSCLFWRDPFLNKCYQNQSRSSQIYCIQNRLWPEARIVFALSVYI